MSKSSTICLVFLLLIVAGCGSSDPKMEVTGRILFEGTPVFPGSVMLKLENDIYTGNLTPEGTFVIRVRKKGSYQVSVQTQDLAGFSKNDVDVDLSSDERPARREEKIPEKFKNANTAIPKTYRKFGTSGLVIEVNESPTKLGNIELD